MRPCCFWVKIRWICLIIKDHWAKIILVRARSRTLAGSPLQTTHPETTRSITEIIFIPTARNVQIHQLWARANHSEEAHTVFAWPHRPLALPSISMLSSCHQCGQRHQVNNVMTILWNGGVKENDLDRWSGCWFINIQLVTITFVIWMIPMIRQQ